LPIRPGFKGHIDCRSPAHVECKPFSPFTDNTFPKSPSPPFNTMAGDKGNEVPSAWTDSAHPTKLGVQCTLYQTDIAEKIAPV